MPKPLAPAPRTKTPVFLELVNVGDEPLRRYEGSKDRPIQEEVYGWWGTVGLKWDL